MHDHVYKLIEITGSSTQSTDDAIRRAVGRTSQTTRHIEWFQVVETRGHIENGEVAHFQVTLKIGFRLEDASSDQASVSVPEAGTGPVHEGP